MSDVQVSIALPLRCTLGEGALWCDRTQRLLFTDIERSVLHALTPADGRHQSWPMSDRVGSFALTAETDRLLLGLAGGVALHELPTGAQAATLPVEPEVSSTRLNDGRCDPQGRFVVGPYNQAKGEAPVGHYHRVDGRSGRLQLERLRLPAVGVANCTAFSPDGMRMYFTDSPTRTIWTVAYPAEGTLGAPELFARLAPDDGFPDGACMDADGGLWVAVWDGAAVARFDANGRETGRIALPARRPTCPAFGGPGLDTLYITSAATGIDDATLALEPGQGALLAVSGTGHRGRPEARFAMPVEAKAASS